MATSVSWQHGDTPPHGFLVQPQPTKVCPHCSVQTQTLAHFCAFCGTSYMRQSPPPPAAQPPTVVIFPRNVRHLLSSIAAAMVILLGLGYATGSFDPWLSQFGLNLEPCIENYVTGNVICGDEARDFCDRLAEPPSPVQPDACKDL